MRARRLLLGGAAVFGLLGAGAVTANVLQDAPRDARPIQSDPIGDILRKTPPNVAPAPSKVPDETPPSGTPAPRSPVAVPAPPVVIAEQPPVVEEVVNETKPEDEIEEAKPVDQPVTPGPRQRRKMAIIQALDKTTASSMRFEVEVGGRPVRFNRNLVFSVRACEVTTADELTEDAIAYVDVTLEPRANTQGTEARQIFRGWMFASSPAVSGLQHPNYDAWVIGCKN